MSREYVGLRYIWRCSQLHIHHWNAKIVKNFTPCHRQVCVSITQEEVSTASRLEEGISIVVRLTLYSKKLPSWRIESRWMDANSNSTNLTLNMQHMTTMCSYQGSIRLLRMIYQCIIWIVSRGRMVTCWPCLKVSLMMSLYHWMQKFAWVSLETKRLSNL